MKGLIAAVAILIVAGGALLYWRSATAPVPETTEHIYASAPLGVGFSYPAGYFITERDRGNGERAHANIMLAEDTEFNRSLVAGEIADTEGPVSITLDVFDNPEALSLESWVRGNGNSNFKLSPDSMLLPTTIAGEAALSYTWDGLYRADAVAVAHGGHIYLFSVTWTDAGSPMRKDFEALLRTVQFN